MVLIVLIVAYSYVRYFEDRYTRTRVPTLTRIHIYRRLSFMLVSNNIDTWYNSIWNSVRVYIILVPLETASEACIIDSRCTCDVRTNISSLVPNEYLVPGNNNSSFTFCANNMAPEGFISKVYVNVTAYV